MSKQPQRLLLRGDDGSDVKWVQNKLWAHGCVSAGNPFWQFAKKKKGIGSPDHPDAKAVWIDGDFGNWTEIALKDFQARHLGERGIPLDEISKMGVCDRDVLLALNNETPKIQEVDNEIDLDKVSNFSDVGSTIVHTWAYYINRGDIKETRGNNRGKYVPSYESTFGENHLSDKPLIKYGGIDFWTGYNPNKPKVKGPAHCCYDRCGIEREAYSIFYGERQYINSKGRTGLCYGNYLWATKQVPVGMEDGWQLKALADHDQDSFVGFTVHKDWVVSGAVKLPTGSAMIMNYGGETGHTGTAAKVIYKGSKAVEIICCEGNISNTLGWRRRKLSQSSIKWFIVAPILLKNPNFKGVGKADAKLTGGKERTR